MNNLLYTFDHDLFLLLNFDGGTVVDTIMTAASIPYTWAWLYIITLFILWRQYGWRRVIFFLLMVVAAVVITDMIAGIFKHSGILKNLWASFPARLRPMHTPELQHAIHKIAEGGLYGTVSAHAGTMVALAMISIYAIGRRWLTYTMIAAVILICYSRIYLAYHFPFDILLGAAVGVLAGYVGIIGYRFLCQKYDNK
ncbi:MAG: phosphatase PAP2 family protein [Alistipes sp.]|nr:phosphatase PAP2 family protein [Alistipes sp.]